MAVGTDSNATSAGRSVRQSPGLGRRCWLLPLVALVPLLSWPTEAKADPSLTDREAVMELQARYFRLLDTKDWAGFRALLTDDVHVDLSADQAGVFDDADAYVAMLQQHGVMVHQGHMPEIELTSPETANGIWAIEDLNRIPAGAGGFLTAHGYGHYHVSYVEVDGQWTVASLTVTRLRLDIG